MTADSNDTRYKREWDRKAIWTSLPILAGGKEDSAPKLGDGGDASGEGHSGDIALTFAGLEGRVGKHREGMPERKRGLGKKTEKHLVAGRFT